MGMTAPAVLAIDGGNSKTEAALVADDGTVLAYARGPGSCHQVIGVEPAMAVLGDLVRRVAAKAGAGQDGPVARHAALYLAGADLAVEQAMLHDLVSANGWAERVVVDNDGFALLRTGTSAPDAVAVVCGAGINCVGFSADGGSFSFASLGRISGDWGGGLELGMAALNLAARAEDGRGAATSLEAAVREHFDRTSVADVSAAIHLGELHRDRVHELAPVLLRVAGDGDEVAATVVHRMAEEVTLLATVALGRLGLLERPADVVLGGGVLTARDPLLMGAVEQALRQAAPHARILVVDAAPVVGAALLGLAASGVAAVEPTIERQLRASLLSAQGVSA